MEGVGLVTGFQFLLGLAAVFAEEVGGFSGVVWVIWISSVIQRCFAITLRIHIRIVVDK